jgi:plastocyanin
MKSIAVLACTVGATVMLAACSSSGSGGSGGSSAPAATSSAATSSAPGSSAAATSGGITISNFAFSGQLSVKAGATVTVVNNDSVAHTLTDKATHLFDTGNLPAGGGKGTFKAPTKPGKYPFGCTYHPNMTGTLTVTG